MKKINSHNSQKILGIIFLGILLVAAVAYGIISVRRMQKNPIAKEAPYEVIIPSLPPPTSAPFVELPRERIDY